MVMYLTPGITTILTGFAIRLIIWFSLSVPTLQLRLFTPSLDAGMIGKYLNTSYTKQLQVERLRNSWLHMMRLIHTKFSVCREIQTGFLVA